MIMSGCSDPLVVSTEELSKVLNRWIREFRADHPLDVHRTTRKKHTSLGDISWIGDYYRDITSESMPTIGAIAYIAERSEKDPRAVIRVSTRETKFTSLELADSLLQAIERTDALHNGEINIVPNPRWSLERWQEWRDSCES